MQYKIKADIIEEERNLRIDPLIKKWMDSCNNLSCTYWFFKKFIYDMQEDYTLTELETGRFIGSPIKKRFVPWDLHKKFKTHDDEQVSDTL